MLDAALKIGEVVPVAEVEQLRGRVVTDGLNAKARVVEIHVPAGCEAVVRDA